MIEVRIDDDIEAIVEMCEEDPPREGEALECVTDPHNWRVTEIQADNTHVSICYACVPFGCDVRATITHDECGEITEQCLEVG